MNEKKSLRVLVVFEFEGIEDPDSNEADAIVESLTYKCDRFRAEAGAHSAWVEEVYGADKEEVNEVERLRAALRKAYELVEEGSEAQGYIAEALAYADGDLSSFDEEV